MRGRSHDHPALSASGRRPPADTRWRTCRAGRQVRRTVDEESRGAFGLSSPSTCNVAHFQFVVVSTPPPGPSLPHLVDLPPLVLRRVVVAEDRACFRLAGCLAPASSGRGGIRHLLLPLREAGRGQPSIKLSTHSFPRAERVLPSSWAGWGPPSRPAPPTGWRRQLLFLFPDRASASQICPGGELRQLLRLKVVAEEKKRRGEEEVHHRHGRRLPPAGASSCPPTAHHRPHRICPCVWTVVGVEGGGRRRRRRGRRGEGGGGGPPPPRPAPPTGWRQFLPPDRNLNLSRCVDCWRC